MIKFIRRTVWFLLFLVLLLFVAYQSILRTQVGSRWVLEFASSQWVQDLTYKKVSGTLIHGLTLEEVSYQDNAVAVNVNKLETGVLKLNYLSPAASLSLVKLDGVLLELKETTPADTAADVPFVWQGLSLPLDVDVLNIKISDFTLQQAGAEALHLNSFNSKLNVQNDLWTIQNLVLEAADFKLNAQAEIETNAKLNVKLNSDWHWQNDDLNWQAELNLNGDLNEITGDLSQRYVDKMIDGHIHSSFMVTDVLNDLNFDVDTTSDELNVMVSEGDIWQVKIPDLNFSGGLDKYHISGQTVINSEQFNVVSASWQAAGNLNGLDIDHLKLDGDAGDLLLKGSLDWQDGLVLTSTLKTGDLNPAWLFADWPGQLDVNAAVNATLVDATQWDVKIPLLDIKGTLKGEQLVMTANGNATSLEQAEVSTKGHWGRNEFKVHGKQSEAGSSRLLDAELTLSQLDLIAPDLLGQVSGHVLIKDNQGQSQIDADLHGQNLAYGSEKIKSAQVKVAAKVGGELSIEATLSDAMFSGQKVNTLSVNADGLLEQHTLLVNLDTDDLITELEIDGAYQQSSTNNTITSYQGTLEWQEITLKSYGGQWSLSEPTGFQWSGNNWQLNKACWQQQLKSTSDKLCVDVASSKADRIAGQLELSQFDLKNWAFLLPDGLSLLGYLEGGLSFEWQADEINIDAQMALLEGVWLIESNEKVQKIAFSEAKLTAQQVNDEAKVNVSFALADGSFLKLDAAVNQGQGADMQLDGEFEGYLADNNVLSGFSDEIKKMEGQLRMSGQVNGPLKLPQVSAKFSLDDGDIELKSIDVPLKNLKAELKNVSQTDFQYLVSAQAGTGQITAEGLLLFPKNQDWQVTSEIKGKEFLVADGSQLTLSLSPQINVKYSGKSTQVTGELLIPKSSINIQELPASVTTVPSDLEYVGTETEVAASSQLVLDVKAVIEDKVTLAVLGLRSDLAGELRLKNEENTQDVKAFGQLQLTNGVYEIYGQALQITQGLLIFDGPLDNPILQIKAQRTAQDKQIVGIKINGDVNNYKTTLFSTPALSDAETLSYIVTGKGLDGLEGSGDSNKIAEAVLMMGLKQNSELINGLKNGLGIDVLSVTNQSETGATVEAGKNLNDKVFVGYNQGIFKHIGYWLLRYKINDKLSLETKQGDEQSVDIVYRREKK